MSHIRPTWVSTGEPDWIAAVTCTEPTQTGYYELTVGPYYFSIEPRPAYCDRGRWIAKVSGPDLDASDGWPRYYFDLERGLAEIQEWLRMRT